MIKRLLISFSVVLLSASAAFADDDADIAKMWDWGRPAESEKHFAQAVDQAKADGNKELEAELLTQAARAQGLQDHFGQADETLIQAERLITDDMPKAKVRLLLERGRVRNSSGDKTGSLPFFKDALNLAKQNNLIFFAVDAAHMLGIAEKKPSEQLAWNQEAMDLAEKCDDPKCKEWLGALYNNTGWTYFDLGQYENALKLFRKDVAFRTKYGDKKAQTIARYSEGRMLRALGRTKEALALQMNLLKNTPSAGVGEQTLGEINEEIGECLLAQGQRTAARRYFAVAYKGISRDPYVCKSEPKRLERLKKLSR